MKQNAETQFVDFDTNKTQVDAFTADVVSVPRKLDADQYSADDIDGVTEDLFGSGNLNYLTLQMGQTNDLILSHSPFELLNQNDASFLNQTGMSQSSADMVAFLSASQSGLNLEKDFSTQGTVSGGDESIGFQTSNTATFAFENGAEATASNTADANLFSSSFNHSFSDQLSSIQIAKDGTNGTNGNNGTNGTNGNNGSNGNHGNNGNNGSDGIDGVTDTICDTVTNITNLLEQIIQLVTNTINHITNVTDTVICNTVNIIDVVTDVVGGVVVEVTDVVDDVLDGVGDTTGDIINVANETVDTVLNDVVDSTIDHLLDTINNILVDVPLVNALPTGEILEGVSELVDNVTEVTTTIVSDVTNIADTLVTNITDNTGDIVTTVGDTVDTLLNETVDDTAEAVFDTVGDILKGDILEGNVVENIVDNFGDIVPDAINTLGNATGDIVGDVASVVDGVAEVVTEDVVDVVEDLVGGVGDVTETLTDILDLGHNGGEGSNDFDLLVDGDLGIVGTDILDVDIDAILDPVESIIGDIDTAIDTGLDLFGGETDNAVGDTDIVIDLGVAGLDLDLDIPLDPIEDIIGDIDLGVGSDIDLLGLGTEDGSLDVLDEVISWPESTIQNVADNLLGGDELGGGLGALLPDPIGDVVEGLGILDVGGHSGSGGGLFGGGLFG